MEQNVVYQDGSKVVGSDVYSSVNLGLFQLRKWGDVPTVCRKAYA